MAAKPTRVCASLALAYFALAPAAASAPLLGTNVANIFSYPAPPAGFDAFTAPQAALEEYGFPPRPGFAEGRVARRQWETLVMAARTRVQPILQQTQIVEGPALHAFRPMGFSVQGSTQYSKNWSGEVLLNNANGYAPGAFTSLAGTFNLPVATQAFGTCAGWDYLSNWVGLDGWASNEVFQAGTEADVYCANGISQAFYSAWLEWYPGSLVRITNLPVAAGDVVLVWMIADGPTTGRAIIVNETSNQAVIMSMSAPAGVSLKGNSAEWIMERPTVNNSLATMTNYVQAWLSDENAVVMGNSQGGNFGTPPLGATSFLVVMLDSNQAPISSAMPAGGTAAVFKDSGSAR